MVKRLWQTLSGGVTGLHEAAYLIAAFALASQALALVRDRLFAHEFGAGEMLDLYYAAFKVPDLVFALVASLVSAYVLIPHIAASSGENARRMLSHAASFLAIGGGGLALVLALFAPAILFFLFPQFEHSPDATNFVTLSRILLLQPVLLGLSGMATSVTQVRRKFFLFSLSPVLYNLGIIGGVLFLYPSFGLAGIGAGVVVGAFLHLVIHIPVLASAGLLPRPVITSISLMRSIVTDSLPRSLALGFGSAVVLALTALAAKTGSGGISAFSLAGNLGAVPLSLIGVSYATAAFPVLAEHAGARREGAFVLTLVTAARHLIFWSTVISVLVIVLRAHIVRAVLGSGAFGWDDTRLTAAVLAVLVVALTAQGLVLLTSRAFYAAGSSWRPFFIQAGGALAAVLALSWAENSAFIANFMESLLRIEDVPGADIVFVACGAALGQMLTGLFSVLALRKIAPSAAALLVRPVLEGLGAGIVGGTAAYGILFFMGNIAPLSTLAAVVLQGGVAGCVGFAAAAGTLFLLENREFRELAESLRHLSLRWLR